jgi:hypothetical protein
MTYLYNPERPFYVYAHYKADTGAIFYVGKGRDKRAWRQDYRGEDWQNIVNKHGIIIKILFYCDDEIIAFMIEKYLIGKIGRLNIKTGPLINLTGGGQGMTGHIQSKERRQKTSDSNRKREVKQITKDRISAKLKGRPGTWIGRKHSKKSKKKQSKYARNRPDSHNNNISLNAKKGQDHPKFDATIYHWINFDGREEFLTRYEFIKLHGFASSNICILLQRKIKQLNGWYVI